MISSQASEIYPQYCFHKSETINQWCRLRASDIASLTTHPGFAGQDVFFHINHPIKWVRVAGVIVAVDEYSGRRVYTVDDSSGVNIECVAALPAKLPGAAPGQTTAGAPGAATVATATLPQTPRIPGDLDVGQVVDVRGGLRLFRDQKQIVIEKAVRLRSTRDEVDFWNKATELRRGLLSRPWVLDKRVVRRCRREAEGDERRARKSKVKAGAKSVVAAGATGDGGLLGGGSSLYRALESTRAQINSTRSRSMTGDGLHPAQEPAVPPAADSSGPRIITGLEKKRRPPRPAPPAHLEGRYSALGL